MIQNDNLQNSGNFYGSFLAHQIENKNPISLENIETILPTYQNTYHYLCPKCQKFPFIEFKDRKNIIITCSCMKNQKIKITHFLDSIEINIIKEYFLSSTIDDIKNNNYNYPKTNKDILSKKDEINDGFMCIKHNKKYEFFCSSCLRNLCNKCFEFKKHICGSNDLFEFKKIDIYNKKIEELINNIDNNRKDTYLEQFSPEEEDFNILIKIIIDDYKNFPNYSHFFNIENILRFLNIRDKLKFKYNKLINDNNEFNENNEIIIEYINNINNKTKLFSKKFVENNKEKVYLEIDGEKSELKKEYIFKSNQKVITIKLILKKEVYEIDLFKMFANCKNLISLDGISKWKKINIINMSKMFYNCSSLSSLPDINEWDVSKVNDFYLIFYNCISLIFFNKEIDLNDIFSGFLISKYFNINNEITIKDVIEDNNHYIYLFGNKYYFK